MIYADLLGVEGLDARQRSLFGILDRAVNSALHDGGAQGVDIAVLHAPIYVDEHAEGEHVYAPKDAVSAGIIYPERAGIKWEIDAIVGFDGRVFFTRIDDVALNLRRAVKGGAR